MRICFSPDFLKDYDKSKQRRSLDAGVVQSPPVPKPRQSIGNSNSNSAAGATAAEPMTAATAESHKPSLRTRSSSLTIHDKRSTSDDALHVRYSDHPLSGHWITGAVHKLWNTILNLTTSPLRNAKKIILLKICTMA